MSRARLRIAYGRIAQETNALSPVLTELSDFEAFHLHRGEALAEIAGPGGDEAPGFLRRAELAGFLDAARADGAIEAIPTLSAWAVPSGPLSRACFDALVSELEERLRAALPLDGVFLSLHGAMGLFGSHDPETELLTRVRRVVGDIPIAASLDLHANLSAARIATGTLFVGYRTNPHRDHASTARRAATILFAAARKEIRPVVAWRSLPMLLGGGNTMDFLPPMRALYRRAKALEQGALLSSSLFPCHPWLNEPEVGWSSYAIADGDQALAEDAAHDLATRAWEVRHQLPMGFVPPEEAIDHALSARWARRLGVVMMADASDVVSAGAPGESLVLVEALMRRGGDLRAYAAVRDPVLVRSLWDTPLGAEVSVSIGGKLDPERNAPLAVRATLRARDHLDLIGDRVLLELPVTPGGGRVALVVTDGPALAVKPLFFTSIGLSMSDADVVVVKNFFPFHIFYARWERSFVYVRTGGVTDLDAALGLTFAGPVHPKDRVDDWISEDRRRRGLTRFGA